MMCAREDDFLRGPPWEPVLCIPFNILCRLSNDFLIAEAALIMARANFYRERKVASHRACGEGDTCARQADSRCVVQGRMSRRSWCSSQGLAMAVFVSSAVCLSATSSIHMPIHSPMRSPLVGMGGGHTPVSGRWTSGLPRPGEVHKRAGRTPSAATPVNQYRRRPPPMMTPMELLLASDAVNVLEEQEDDVVCDDCLHKPSPAEQLHGTSPHRQADDTSVVSSRGSSRASRDGEKEAMKTEMLALRATLQEQSEVLLGLCKMTIDYSYPHHTLARKASLCYAMALAIPRTCMARVHSREANVKGTRFTRPEVSLC